MVFHSNPTPGANKNMANFSHIFIYSEAWMRTGLERTSRRSTERQRKSERRREIEAKIQVPEQNTKLVFQSLFLFEYEFI